jgi:hypothetical protein
MLGNLLYSSRHLIQRYRIGKDDNTLLASRAINEKKRASLPAHAATTDSSAERERRATPGKDSSATQQSWTQRFLPLRASSSKIPTLTTMKPETLGSEMRSALDKYAGGRAGGRVAGDSPELTAPVGKEDGVVDVGDHERAGGGALQVPER